MILHKLFLFMPQVARFQQVNFRLPKGIF